MDIDSQHAKSEHSNQRRSFVTSQMQLPNRIHGQNQDHDVAKDIHRRIGVPENLEIEAGAGY